MKNTRKFKKYFADRKDKLSLSGISIEMDWLLIVFGFFILAAIVISISITKITSISSGSVFDTIEAQNTLGDDEILKKVDATLEYFEAKANKVNVPSSPEAE